MRETHESINVPILTLMDDPQISPECKGVVEPGRTELAYELAGVKITVKNVRASVCNNPHALRAQQNMKIRYYLAFIFISIFWGAKRQPYSTLDVRCWTFIFI